jgi:hypothetical protein
MICACVIMYSGVFYNERCYNERLLQWTVLSKKSGCYNEHRCYNERGGILLAEVERACAYVLNCVCFLLRKVYSEFLIRKDYLCFSNLHTHTHTHTHTHIYIYSAVLKRLATPSDFHIPLPSIVPLAHSQTPFTHGCIYSIFPGSSGATSFFPTFRFPVNHNFCNCIGSIHSTCPYQMSCFRVMSSNNVSWASIFPLT